MEINIKLALISIYLICHIILLVDANDKSNTINVLEFGAKADGVTDDSKAFLAAWGTACNASGEVVIMVPLGEYLLNPLKFKGPCRKVRALTIQLQGILKATNDLNAYTSDTWIRFERVNGLTLTGGGTFDGQGKMSWPTSKCPKHQKCKRLPISIKFVGAKNTTVKEITSLNSKSYHMTLVNCNNFEANHVIIQAPQGSPRTDGIHMERSTGVTIVSSTISTGGGCVTIGHGTSRVAITDVDFGLGDGISIGSLGKKADEKDVENISVKDCTFSDTTYGVCIKTFANSAASTRASNLVFENFIMSKVGHPIMIDQEFCPNKKCDASSSSRVQLKDVHFSNIRGSASMHDAVAIKCSKDVPCENVTISYVDLQSFDSRKDIATVCRNARPVFTGTNNPPPC